jgi:hypothetical protein
MSGLGVEKGWHQGAHPIPGDVSICDRATTKILIQISPDRKDRAKTVK